MIAEGIGDGIDQISTVGLRHNLDGREARVDVVAGGTDQISPVGLLQSEAGLVEEVPEQSEVTGSVRWDCDFAANSYFSPQMVRSTSRW